MPTKLGKRGFQSFSNMSYVRKRRDICLAQLRRECSVKSILPVVFNFAIKLTTFKPHHNTLLSVRHRKLTSFKKTVTCDLGNSIRDFKVSLDIKIMHNCDRYPATASQFMLREIKRRQELVHRGHQLLKRMTEALRFRGRQTASDLTVTQAVLGHTLREAYISLAAVKFTNGESNALVLENIGQAQVRVHRIPENISGVATVSLQAIEESGISDALRYAGLGAGGHRTGEAKKAFREAIHILIKFASLRNTCILLDAAIRSTLRKVNGIEKVIMPKLSNTENYIQMEMAEREREEMHRLKMVKAKKIRAKALAKLRSTRRDMSGSGEAFDGVKNPSHIRSMECLTSLLYTCNSPLSSTTESGGDYKPTCYPPGWDDDDLIF